MFVKEKMGIIFTKYYIEYGKKYSFDRVEQFKCFGTVTEHNEIAKGVPARIQAISVTMD